MAKASRHRDALADRSNNVRDVERQERLLQKQLGNINARTSKLKTKGDEEAERARKRMEELRETHAKLTEERGEKGREMAELKDNIEKEVHAAHDEYLKMESHIKLYITEMEQSI